MPKGIFTVADGPDGGGKDYIVEIWGVQAVADGKRVLDLRSPLKEYTEWPLIEEVVGEYDVILTCEPTFNTAGRLIRNSLIAKPKTGKRRYSPEAIAEGFALDRRILYEIMILPALKAGIDIYQSRSVSTSLVYQTLDGVGKDFQEGVDKVLAIPGNRFCYDHPMDHLVIVNVSDAEIALFRSQAREKQDNSLYENVNFLEKVVKRYDSNEFRALFESKGVKVHRVDNSREKELFQQYAKEFYRQHLRH